MHYNLQSLLMLIISDVLNFNKSFFFMLYPVLFCLDLSDKDVLDMKVANRSPYNLRNRRAAAAEKGATSNCPEKELKPEKRPGTSHVLDSSCAAETRAKAAWTVEDVCKLTLPEDETSEDAEVCGSCSVPVVTSADHENEEKVSLVYKVMKANLFSPFSK